MAAPATVVAGASIIVSSDSLRTTSNQPLSSNLRVSPAAASAHHSAMVDARGSSSRCAIPVCPETAIDILSFNSMRFPQIFYVQVDLKWSMAPPYNAGHAWRAVVIFPTNLRFAARALGPHGLIRPYSKRQRRRAAIFPPVENRCKHYADPHARPDLAISSAETS